MDKKDVEGIRGMPMENVLKVTNDIVGKQQKIRGVEWLRSARRHDAKKRVFKSNDGECKQETNKI